MDGPPPPPPPHGANPKSTSGLPPGNYDIFIIPPHSAGGGFVYLPSLKPQRNSFLAGVVSTLAAVGVWTLVEPTVKRWFATIAAGVASGGTGVVVLIVAVGLAGWLWGKTQTEGLGGSGDGPPSPGGGRRGPGGGSPGAGFGAGRPPPNGYPGGTPPHSPPPGGGPNPGFTPPPHGHHYQQYSNQAPPRQAPPRPPTPPPQTPPPPPPQPEPEPTPKPNPPNSEQAKGQSSWEKAREETRKREEARKTEEELKRRREEEQRKKEEAERQARAKAEKEKWEKMRAREKEIREREARERIAKERMQKEQEAREREAKEREAREAELRAKVERELREKLQAEQAEAVRKKAEEDKIKAELEAKLAREKAEKDRAERLKAARERAEKEREARKKAEKEKAEAATAKPSVFGVGERTDPYARPAPSVTSARTSPIKATVRDSTSSPRTNYEKPSVKSYMGTPDSETHSYRPYDQPRRGARTAGSSIYSESSYAPSQSTARTTPPPSQRGPYTTQDPDKVVIKGVYLFNDLFPKPVAQLVSGIGNVTDGLVLKITTEGLFIDDDVRHVAQREWDVKAWTMKLVEVCRVLCSLTCPFISLLSSVFPLFLVHRTIS